MNSGSFLVMDRFSEFDTAREVLSKVSEADWIPTIPDGPYKSDGWRVIKIFEQGKPTAFAEKHPEIKRAIGYFECPIVKAMFYSMLPGAELHPHRDSSGTLELGLLRFHIPIETNPDVSFMVSKKRVPMKSGELWALNTSYLHAVENKGQTDRVHLVVEVEANEWCWSKLPKKNMKFYAHYSWFMMLVVGRAMRLALTDPKAIQSRLDIGKFIAKRLVRHRRIDQ
jgi:hypothetical protein